MARFTAILAFLAAASTFSLAAPAPNADAAQVTHYGDGTYYNVADGAQVSCGGYYKNTDYVVAANPTWVNGRCGRRITAYHNNNQVTVTLVDTCPGCDSGSLDFSPSAFQALAPLSEGRISISWHFEA